MTKVNLLENLMVTSELCGTVMSEAAVRVMLEDLSTYPLEQVLASLKRCRREVKGRLTLADVIFRLEDGRPGVEEAWAMIPRSEQETVVLTPEIMSAWSVALPMIESGDLIAARMAFKEKYQKLVQEARDSNAPLKWSVSLGHDVGGREGPVVDAVSKGRLTQQAAAKLLPGVKGLPDCSTVKAMTNSILGPK